MSLRTACNKLIGSKYSDEINRAVIFRGAARFLPRIRKEKLVPTRLIPTEFYMNITQKN